MFKAGAFRSKVLAGGIAAALLVVTMPLPTAAMAQATSYARQGTLQGTVYNEGMKSRVSNAVVKIRNLNTQKEYSSAPSDAKGNYKILMIEEGWYTLGVSTPAGDFNLNYGIYVKSGETAKLSVEMLPGGVLEGKGGSGGSGGKGFFSSTAGVLVIVALAGAAGYGVYQLTKNEDEVSPIK